jgi:hypothetical protein
MSSVEIPGRLFRLDSSTLRRWHSRRNGYQYGALPTRSWARRISEIIIHFIRSSIHSSAFPYVEHVTAKRLTMQHFDANT